MVGLTLGLGLKGLCPGYYVKHVRPSPSLHLYIVDQSSSELIDCDATDVLPLRHSEHVPSCSTLPGYYVLFHSLGKHVGCEAALHQ